jgi:hypothetical protein
MYRRMCETQSLSARGVEDKIPSPPGSKPPAIQSVVIHFTRWAIHLLYISCAIKYLTRPVRKINIQNVIIKTIKAILLNLFLVGCYINIM